MENSNKLFLTSSEEVTWDDHYRYKIVCLEVTHATQKGRAITLLPNFSLFCEQLQFPEDKLLRIIGKRLATKSSASASAKSPALQGTYSPDQVKKIVYSFIQDILLCSACDKPEVKLKYHPIKGVKQSCKACGVKNYLPIEKIEDIQI